jgi:DNA helicase-2/ATP-dependent DNA helicase PcrA
VVTADSEGPSDVIGRGLNAPQREAVRHGEGPLLILAGAGSGKTRVITHRIAELLRRGVPPYRILAVTFTNKAAGEMRERVERLVGARAHGMWIGTFHATCARLLRTYAAEAGLTRDFVIFDDGDQKTLITRVLKDLGIADRFASPRAMLSAIDQAKNRGEGPEEFHGDEYFSDLVARVYPVYQERLERSGGVDFGDLLLKCLRLCERHPETSVKLAEKFEHVLVDEFQDTNRVQYRFVRHLASAHGNLCVVGDDDQSIYAWRGADVRNILDFERDHPGTKVVKLEQNYRSSEVILEAANAVIARNLERKQKRLFTEVAGGEPILYHTADDERREAEWVVRTIRKLEHDEGRVADDFAVFYRTHAQSRALEEALRAADLTYSIVGGTRFYDRAEVKDLLAYLRLVANPSDEVSLERVINRPTRGIGDTTYDRVAERAGAERRTVWETMRRVVEEGDPALSAGPRKKLGAFVHLIEELRTLEAEGVGLSTLAEAVLDRSAYLERLAAERTHESEERIENLMELVGSMKAFQKDREGAGGGSPTLHEYLELVSLVAPADDKSRGVTLMTVHAAKGLEFPVVFVTGLEDGVFPSLRNGETREVIEEERRLAYVSITRARERLFFTNARERRLFGQAPRPFRESRFLDDVPDACIARPVAPPRRAFGQLPPSLVRGAASGAPRTVDRGGGVSVEYDVDAGSFAAGEGEGGEGAGFRLGQRVRHPKFGEGEVRAVTGAGAELKLTVYFRAVGPKTIIARFVELV